MIPEPIRNLLRAFIRILPFAIIKRRSDFSTPLEGLKAIPRENIFRRAELRSWAADRRTNTTSGQVGERRLDTFAYRLSGARATARIRAVGITERQAILQHHS